jgi:hypothetical protein
MYNAHRGMVPAPNSRLTELLDQLRQEFESQSRNTGEFEHQCMCPISPYLSTAIPPLFLSFGSMRRCSFPLLPTRPLHEYKTAPWVPTFAEMLSN